nr:PilZ domain-containing protein [Desulfobulbaceae bacterium]
MSSAPTKIENRKSKRFLVRDNAFALLKQPQYKELGRIVDISETGISFLCINQGDWTEAPFNVDIFLSDELELPYIDQNILKNIPLRPVAYCRDNILSCKNPDSMMTRCGVAFGTLSSEQRSRIKQFIVLHSVGNA